jgi:ABC-type bacteriocin/lantibiotic exporter with double-glycine peptidase domain
LLKEIFSLLDSSDVARFKPIVLLTVIFSLVEIVGISLIMPFIQMATDFSQIHEHSVYQQIYTFLDFHKDFNFIIFFGLSLIVFYVLRTLFSLYYYKSIATFVRESYYSISTKLFKNYIGMRYRDYIERNSSHFVQAIVSEANNVSNILFSLVIIFGEIFIIILIYSVLLYVNWKLTLLITLFLAINILIMSQTVSKKIKNSGEIRAYEQRNFHEILGNAFGNFKMIKLQTDEKNMIDRFENSCRGVTKAYITSETLSHSPRLFLEAMGFVLVISIVLYWVVSYGSDVSAMMGVLTLFIVALYRLMPSFNRIVTNYNSFLFNKKALDLVGKDMNIKTEMLGSEDIVFKREITVKNISFDYIKDRATLKDINITIKKGEKVAFVGESGSGKSTLVDVIIGLLVPKDGYIMIDDIKLSPKNLQAWRKKIGYIPQDVYLFDATVAENVAFTTRDKVDEERLVEVLKEAEIYSFLKEHQDGIDTYVGEGGVKLSGGQKQRVAIARALYHKPEILVMDEATSALDDSTEKAIMKKIYEVGKDKTMIMIAHRLSTIEGCDRVYRVENGKVDFK